MIHIPKVVAGGFFVAALLLLIAQPDELPRAALHAAVLGLFCLGLWAITLIVLMPINYYWWRILGLLN